MISNLNSIIDSVGNLANRLKEADAGERQSNIHSGVTWNVRLSDGQFNDILEQYNNIILNTQEVVGEIGANLNSREIQQIPFADLSDKLRTLRRFFQDPDIQNLVQMLGSDDQHAYDTSLIINLGKAIPDAYRKELESVFENLSKIGESLDQSNFSSVNDLLTEARQLLTIFNEGEPSKDRSLVYYQGFSELRNNIIVKFRQIFTEIFKRQLEDVNGAASSSASSSSASAATSSSDAGAVVVSERPTVEARREVVRLFNEFEPLINSHREEIHNLHTSMVFNENTVWFPFERLDLINDSKEAFLVTHQYAADFDRLIKNTRLDLFVDQEHAVIDIGGDQLTAVEAAKRIEGFLVECGLSPTDGIQTQLLLSQTALSDLGAVMGGLNAHIADDERLENLFIDQNELKILEHSVQFIKNDNSINFIVRSEIPLKYRGEEGVRTFAKFLTTQIIKLEGDKNNAYKPSQADSCFTYSLIQA